MGPEIRQALTYDTEEEEEEEEAVGQEAEEEEAENNPEPYKVRTSFLLPSKALDWKKHSLRPLIEFHTVSGRSLLYNGNLFNTYHWLLENKTQIHPIGSNVPCGPVSETLIK